MHRGRPIVYGALKEVKRSFGKMNIIIHADFPLDELADFPGVVKMKRTAEGVHLQIENEDVSQKILSHIAGKGFIRKFALVEPSLNDIFIEKVGAAYE